MRFRVRINMLCNSGGNSSGNFSSFSSFSSAASVEVAGVGALFSVFFVIFGNAIFGVGIVISGFLLRIISVVVAMYSGNADNISKPKTNPAKPCSSARANLCHWAALNMLKLNKKYSMNHTSKT